MPGLNTLATTPWRGPLAYGDAVHIVHVYVIEPHPAAPDVSPYRGEVWEARYSTLGQPLELAVRTAHAAQTEVLLTGPQRMLVDDLDPGGLVNPIWCTYGPAPNAAYLIRPDGGIELGQIWLDVDAMRDAIDLLLE